MSNLMKLGKVLDYYTEGATKPKSDTVRIIATVAGVVASIEEEGLLDKAITGVGIGYSVWMVKGLYDGVKNVVQNWDKIKGA